MSENTVISPVKKDPYDSQGKEQQEQYDSQDWATGVFGESCNGSTDNIIKIVPHNGSSTTNSNTQ